MKGLETLVRPVFKDLKQSNNHHYYICIDYSKHFKTIVFDQRNNAVPRQRAIFSFQFSIQSCSFIVHKNIERFIYSNHPLIFTAESIDGVMATLFHLS